MRQPSATHRSSCQDVWALGDAGRRPLKPMKFKGHKVYHYYPLTLWRPTESLFFDCLKWRLEGSKQNIYSVDGTF